MSLMDANGGPLGDARVVKQVRISLEIDPDAEPIAGRFRLEGEDPRLFAGILELIALIDARRNGSGDADGAGGGRPAKDQ